MSEIISSRRCVLKSALGFAAVAALPAGAFAKSSPRVAVTATALNDRLLLVSGLGGNVLALRGDEGLLLVDTGAAGATSKLQSELKKFGRGAKVSTVINTHWHTDHTGGNDVFAKGGAKIISHAKAAQRMAVAQYVPWEDRYLKARAKSAVPTEVFYLGKKELKFGGETIEYGYLQQPHTDGDIYVHLRESNVLVVGDSVSPQLDPMICWYEGGWVGGRVDSQAKLLALGNAETRIVAGTGGVVAKAEVKAERDALEKVFDRMSDAMRKGFTTEDMQKAKLLDGLTRAWADPDKFIYDAHKSMWAHYNKLSHTIV
jgi:glyoxylase-like metal-dependent hydrolase (beta-lactamase superfamily II)